MLSQLVIAELRLDKAAYSDDKDPLQHERNESAHKEHEEHEEYEDDPR